MLRLLLLLLLPLLVLADHLPDRLIAVEPAERTLCGIDVTQTKVLSLVERFGKPEIDKKYPETEEAREIVWQVAGSQIHATINVADIAYAVDVSGKPGPTTKTGRGLGLGQTLNDLKRVYGTRFQKKGNNVILQWKNGTEMRAKLLGTRLVSLELIAQVE